MWSAGWVAVRRAVRDAGQADMRGFGWPQDHGFVVGSRCLMNGRGQCGLVAQSAFAGSPRVPGRDRPSRRDREWFSLVVHSIWVIAQQNPASSRAAATAMIVRRLARCSRRVQVR